MAVLATDIIYRESLETDSLGGAISPDPVPTNLNGFFGDVDFTEATDGSTAYRCFYIINESATDTLTGTEIYIGIFSTSASTHCELGLGSSGVDGIEQTITSENIAPVGVTFVVPTDLAPLPMPDLGPGQYHAVWIKRVVNPNAEGTSNDTVILALRGDGGGV